MKPGVRLPLLTEILDLAPDATRQGVATPEAAAMPQSAESAPTSRVVGSLAALRPDAGAPVASAASAGDHLAVSQEMARAVLELELEQALREVLEPRLHALLHETAAELALRLQPRMHEWLDEHGSPE